MQQQQASMLSVQAKKIRQDGQAAPRMELRPVVMALMRPALPPVVLALCPVLVMPLRPAVLNNNNNNNNNKALRLVAMALLLLVVMALLRPMVMPLRAGGQLLLWDCRAATRLAFQKQQKSQ
jgi:hypothetical protein